MWALNKARSLKWVQSFCVKKFDHWVQLQVCVCVFICLYLKNLNPRMKQSSIFSPAVGLTVRLMEINRRLLWMPVWSRNPPFTVTLPAHKLHVSMKSHVHVIITVHRAALQELGMKYHPNPKYNLASKWKCENKKSRRMDETKYRNPQFCWIFIHWVFKVPDQKTRNKTVRKLCGLAFNSASPAWIQHSNEFHTALTSLCCGTQLGPHPSNCLFSF